MHTVDNVGTVPAAVAAYLAVQSFAPDLVVNAGTAGGFKSRGAAIGDVYVGTSTVHHDRRIPLAVGESVRGCMPGWIMVWDGFHVSVCILTP